MAGDRHVDYTTCELDAILAKFAGARLCLDPLITYLRQKARTASDAQALRNALDLQAELLAAQRLILARHPKRRRD